MRHRLLALPLALLLAGCADRDPALLKLNGESVRRSDFERHLALVEARDVGPLSPEARAGLLDAFLEQRALVIEARRRGLLPAKAGAQQELEAVTRLIDESLRPAEVSEPEIAAWAAAHAAELVTPERVSLRQVLVATLNEARDVKRRLGSDARTFDGLARAVSKGPEAAVGGYMGSFERGQLPPELEAARLQPAPRGDERADPEPARVSCPSGRVPTGSPRNPPRGGTREDPRPSRPREAGGGRAGLRGGNIGSGQGES